MLDELLEAADGLAPRRNKSKSQWRSRNMLRGMQERI